MQKLNKALLFLLPAVVFFTNFPIIKLGETEAMHLEISLPEIWLVLFALTSLPNLKRLVQTVSIKMLAIVSLFPLYATLSIIWSSNRLRALLTAGLLWLIVFAIMNILYLLMSPSAAKNVAASTAKSTKTASTQAALRHKLLQVFLITSAAVSIFCWLQCLLDLLNVARADSLMCAGCTYLSFGFPHPNGFAIEPQFMGGLLIAPALTSFYFAFARTKRSFVCQSRTHRRVYLALAVFFSMTLFLTFSRGAIYAFIVAVSCLVFALIFAGRNDSKKTPKSPLLIFPAVISAFLITLTAQGLMATISPTSDDFVSGVTKALHHLTLGHLDLRPVENVPENATSATAAKTTAETAAKNTAGNIVERETKNTSENAEPVPARPPQSIYGGYVSESTDIRVNFTNLALAAATKTPATLIFGAGLGSAGTVLNREFPEKVGSPKEIVQNEYASILLELGLVGIGLLATTIVYIFVSSIKVARQYAKRNNMNFSTAKAFAAVVLDPPNVCIIAIIIGYMLTLFFFSGLPNAFHVYLVPPLLFGILVSPGNSAFASNFALARRSAFASRPASVGRRKSKNLS